VAGVFPRYNGRYGNPGLGVATPLEGPSLPSRTGRTWNDLFPIQDFTKQLEFHHTHDVPWKYLKHGDPLKRRDRVNDMNAVIGVSTPLRCISYRIHVKYFMPNHALHCVNGGERERDSAGEQIFHHSPALRGSWSASNCGVKVRV